MRVMLSLFWTRTSAAAPVVAVSLYRKDLQLFPGNGNVSIFALVPVPCLSGASLSPFPLEIAACSARVKRFIIPAFRYLSIIESTSFATTGLYL